jgi:predicted TIM-barrel fold metal-dependent hydrolase
MALYTRVRVDADGKWLCDGPDPEPQATGWDVPRDACDCHVQLFGPYELYPLAPDRAYTPPETEPAALFHMIDTLTLDRVVLSQATAHGLDNRAMIEMLRANPDGFRGVAMIDPNVDEEVLATLADSGVVAARVDGLVPGGIGVEAAEAIARRIEPYGWHLEVLVDGRYLPFVRESLLALPVPVVLEHFAHMPIAATLGHPGFIALWDLMRSGKVWIKLSGAYRISAEPPPWSDVVAYAQAMIASAPDQVVWGSDWPHAGVRNMPPANTGDTLEQLYDFAPDAALRARILVDNPARLYRFG